MSKVPYRSHIHPMSVVVSPVGEISSGLSMIVYAARSIFALLFYERFYGGDTFVNIYIYIHTYLVIVIFT